MGFLTYQITSFAKPVSALADQPRMSAQELKAWFDSNSTGEIKGAVNGIAELLDSESAAGAIGCTTYRQVGGTVQSALGTLTDYALDAARDARDSLAQAGAAQAQSRQAREAAQEALLTAQRAEQLAQSTSPAELIDPESGEKLGIQEILYRLYYRFASSEELTCGKWDMADWQCGTFDEKAFTCLQFDLSNIFNN